MSRERGMGEDRADALGCSDVRDLLPLEDLGRHGRVSPEVEAHLLGCAECRAEAEFVARLKSLRPEPPNTILRGVMDRARPPAEGTRRRWGTGSWLSAAAATVLALGLGLLWDSPTADDSVWTSALEPEPASWYGEEWMVAGGPVPDALSDDVLMALLEEMDP